MTYVKICGLREPAHVSAATDAGADAVGFVLTASPRQVTPARARELCASVPPHILTVAVFTTEPLDVIRAAAAQAAVRAIQLHGDHPPEHFAALRDLPVRLVRAVSGASGADLCCGAYGEDILIVDSPRAGSGQTWAWHAMTGRPTGRWLLAGGLTPANVAAALAAVRPWGVDVSSGVEISRGVKDAGLIRKFIAAARAMR